MQLPLNTLSFTRLVAALRLSKKTCAVVEQCCGGLISASIMAQSGASHVYLGGSVVYHTRQAKPLLLNDDDLYKSLLELNTPPSPPSEPLSTEKSSSVLSEEAVYVQSKVDWTAKTSVAFCKQLDVDYVIAESGATGPTFRPAGMTTGVAVVAVAGKRADGTVAVLQQKIVRSSNSNRLDNMHFFAESAAELTLSVVSEHEGLTSTIISDNESLSSRPDKSLGNNIVSQLRGGMILDRSTHLRSNAETLARLEEQEKSVRYVLLSGKKILVSASTDTDLVLLEKNDMTILTDGKETRKTFLGMLSHEKQPEAQKTAVFCIDILGETNTDTTVGEDVSFVDTRTTAPLFSRIDNQLALYATAMVEWQRRTKYCASCGGPTLFRDGGTVAQCTVCQTKIWPRQDPSMIAVISSRDGERVLLGHAKRHPPKLYTVLAGFVEAGETFEAAVAREAFEETGVYIDEGSVQYAGSQPWPFPQSCMIGFTATADDTSPLIVDANELEHAAWFDRSDVVKAATVAGSTMQRAVAEAALISDPSLPLLIPPKGVIARKLIDLWLEDRPI